MKVFSPLCVDSMLGNIHAEINKRASGMFKKRIERHQNLNQSSIKYSNDGHCKGIVVISSIVIMYKKKNHCLQFIVKAVTEEQLLMLYLFDGPYYFHF